MSWIVFIPFAPAAATIAAIYLRDGGDAGRRRAQFRSYMDIAIRYITVENANNLAIYSSFQACIDYKEFDDQRKNVRPDIVRKGAFDAACEACKTVGFIAYNDVERNAKQKAELLKRLMKVRSLAW